MFYQHPHHLQHPGFHSIVDGPGKEGKHSQHYSHAMHTAKQNKKLNNRGNMPDILEKIRLKNNCSICSAFDNYSQLLAIENCAFFSKTRN